MKSSAKKIELASVDDLFTTEQERQQAGDCLLYTSQASTDGTGDDGAGHVRSAAREGVHRTV